MKRNNSLRRAEVDPPHPSREESGPSQGEEESPAVTASNICEALLFLWQEAKRAGMGDVADSIGGTIRVTSKWINRSA
ncbi:hypothetical protein [Telmatospirillum sp. J64-1]|uniref:hypothetical protein n=1 Tax=Telmatospirillum sp. J64-1 TaxID=2502183 RepID=UPI00115C7EFD|nr:hypothetical protein [Telmatospirillum sp. J64-1]